jgi:glutathionyl-hydroquinone reductase
MPQLSQPPALRHMLIANMIVTLNDRCLTWMRILSRAAEAGHGHYLKAIQNVENERQEVHEILTSLPIHISEDITATVIRRFIDIIAWHDAYVGKFKAASSYDEEKYNAVCLNVLRSVLLPSTKYYDMTHIKSSFAQKLMIQAIESVRNFNVFFFRN